MKKCPNCGHKLERAISDGRIILRCNYCGYINIHKRWKK